MKPETARRRDEGGGMRDEGRKTESGNLKAELLAAAVVFACPAFLPPSRVQSS
jgi:hypothetical protein